jgi:hypothetical protein
LLVTELLGHVGFVQALQRAIVALVQPVVVDHRQPGAVHLIQGEPEGEDGALEHRGVAQVKVQAFGLEQFARRHGLAHAGGGQVHIGPAGEAVFQVPGGFAMANEDKFVHRKEALEAF